MNAKTILKQLPKTLKKNSPHILMGFGIVGMCTTTILAVRATPKALQLLEEKKQEEELDILPPVDILKTTWKVYIPAIATGAVSVLCLITANTTHAKRTAALATAYTLSEGARKEYREKVLELFGDKKEKTVRDEIAKDRVIAHPVGNREVIITRKGNTMCYEPLTDRYFESNVEVIQRAVNIINKNILEDGSVSLNDWFYELGLHSVENIIGDTLGWCDRELLEIDFTSVLMEDMTPCLSINYVQPPRYGYDSAFGY